MKGEKSRKVRVLMAKLGLDGHDRGALVVSRALAEAGIEVIYTGRHQTPEQIVKAAIEEDVDVIGISSLADAHCTLVPKVTRLLKENKVEDVLVILGGFIQPEDIPFLKEEGVAEVFGGGTRLETIVNFIRDNVSRNRMPY